MAAAGTSDPGALRDLRVTAALLSAAIGVGSSWPTPPPGSRASPIAVADLRARGARRVVVASYLLADGLFQDRLRASGADVVTEPLGTHPGVARLIASRFRRARLPSPPDHRRLTAPLRRMAAWTATPRSTPTAICAAASRS